jgi:aldehyde:ferredoxin oxidoreductase
MPEGFFAKVLLVDLSSRSLQIETVDSNVYQDVLGGYGLGVRLLLDRMPAGADPLGPDNILGFVPGLLTGTGVPFSGRFMVVGKSPLTGGWGDANCGGHFGPALRSTGLDGVFVSGASNDPLYLVVDAEQPDAEPAWELRDASDLWGLDTVEVEQRLKEEVGRGAEVIAIGPAAEKRALIAALITDGGRAAARSGLAAVMGAKGLKAVVVRGRERVPVHDAAALRKLNRAYVRIFKKDDSPLSPLLFQLTKSLSPVLRMLRIKPSGPSDTIIHLYRTYGTSGGTAFTTAVGDAPIQNWRGVAMRDFPLSRSERISDAAVIQHQVRSYHCRTCPVGCGGIVHMDGDSYTVEEGHKPEYETLGAFGPLVLNDDLEAIIEINTLCDRLGLDTISTGATVAFAIECAEAGLIDPCLRGGLTLSWGDADAMVELVRRIGRREGLGDLLADGVKRAAEQIGAEADPFAIHAGGQELPMHDSRYEPALGLAYAVDPTPGRHNTANGGYLDVPGVRQVFEDQGLAFAGRYDYLKKGREFALLNRYLQIVNCAGLCQFSLMMSRPPVREWINAATGWSLSLQDLLRVGHRVQVLRQLFNLREGIPSDGVVLPGRARGEPPLERGPLRGVTLDMEAMKQDFFQAMGYDQVGVPTLELLGSLGLSDLAVEGREEDHDV